jgi:membrane protease YdiL (CAAX protease family)
VSILYLGILGTYMAHAMVMHRKTGPETAEETQLHRGMPAPLMPLFLFLACQALATPALEKWLLSPAVLACGGALLLAMILNQLRRKHRAETGDSAAARIFYVSGGLLQTVLLVMACYYAFRNGVLGRGLFEPQWVILGLAAGHLIFGVSLLFSHRSLDSVGEIVKYIADPRPLWAYAMRSPRQLFACLDVSFIEELVYRVTAQALLISLVGNAPVAILVTAVVFSVVHRHFFYNHIVDSIEFLAFSILLGALYYWTGSLMLVVLVHTVRNVEIVYFDQATHAPTEGEVRPGMAMHPFPGTRKGLLSYAP